MIYKKPAIQLLLTFVLFFTAIPFASAASATKAVYINGTKVQYAQAPIVEDGITLVSARETIEAMGLAFQWDSSNNRIIGTSSTGETTIAIVIGQFSATINGMSLVLDTRAVAKNGRMMVPLRFLTQSLGAAVSNKGNAITIRTVAEKKEPYYTGLPLEITNTYVRNRSKQTVTVEYEEFASHQDRNITYSHSVTLKPGKKGVFELAKLEPGDKVDGEDALYLGRAVKSVTVESDEAGIITDNKSYDKAYKSFSSGDFENKLSAVLDKTITELEAELKQLLKQMLVKNKYVPLMVTEAYISYGVLDTPEANIELMNLTEKNITSVDLTFKTYDNYGDPAVDSISGTNLFKATTRTFRLKPGERITFTWDMYWRDTASSFRNITITKVAYSDGTVWKKK